MARLADISQCAAVMAEPEGNRPPSCLPVDYGRIDSGLNEAGLRVASLCGVVENWSGLTQHEKRTQKEQWMDRLIADLDRQFPGFAAAIVHREMATAETMQHSLNTPGGAVYGFAPEGSGPIHIASGTAIDGLWRASA